METQETADFTDVLGLRGYFSFNHLCRHIWRYLRRHMALSASSAVHGG
jgi:hypothetical protein